MHEFLSSNRDELIARCRWKVEQRPKRAATTQQLALIHKAKAAFMDIPDGTFDKAAGSLAKIPTEKVTMGRIFLTTLWSTPSLIWKMRSLI